MILVKFHDEDYHYITETMLKTVPRIGEKIWFVPMGSHKTCEVIDVCYWIAIDNDNSYQAACVYLKEI